jgi:hypothetical protein
MGSVSFNVKKNTFLFLLQIGSKVTASQSQLFFKLFTSNIVAGLIAYSFLPKNFAIKYQTVKTN